LLEEVKLGQRCRKRGLNSFLIYCCITYLRTSVKAAKFFPQAVEIAVVDREYGSGQYVTKKKEVHNFSPINYINDFIISW
jgi:hypothetical protein